MYCIILPRALGKMIQPNTHFECLISSTNVTLCLFFFLSSCSQYLTVYYTFKSNKIYPVIKAGTKYFKKVDHFAPVSPSSDIYKRSLPLDTEPECILGKRSREDRSLRASRDGHSSSSRISPTLLVFRHRLQVQRAAVL